VFNPRARHRLAARAPRGSARPCLWATGPADPLPMLPIPMHGHAGAEEPAAKGERRTPNGMDPWCRAGRARLQPSRLDWVKRSAHREPRPPRPFIQSQAPKTLSPGLRLRLAVCALLCLGASTSCVLTRQAGPDRGIRLRLSAPKATFVEGDAIPLTLAFKNTTEGAVILPPCDPFAGEWLEPAFLPYGSSVYYEAFRRDHHGRLPWWSWTLPQMDPDPVLLRAAAPPEVPPSPPPPPRQLEEELWTLGAKETKLLTFRLEEVVGPLPPGRYKIYIEYEGDGGEGPCPYAHLLSNRITIHVRSKSPADSRGDTRPSP